MNNSMSVMGMFNHSDLFMKILVLLLLFLSVWCWAIIFEKVLSFRQMKKKIKKFEDRFWSGTSLDDIWSKMNNRSDNPIGAIFLSAMKELKRVSHSKNSKTGVSVLERVERAMQITIDNEIDKLNRKMLVLSSTGSVSPLLGLFGTVWGIMDSFNAIGSSGSTNIASVAPGVAEALLTTAVGLIAAIPALVAHNKFAHDIDRIAVQMDTFSEELLSIISRQSDIGGDGE